MKMKLLLLLCGLSVQLLCAQELYLNTGKNFTTYDYSKSNGESNKNIRSGSGSSYEVGYIHPINKKFAYAVAITWDQLNAEGANGSSIYKWNTNYVGIQNAIIYTVFKTSSDLELNFKAAINTIKLANGRQLLNNEYYDLTKQNEFNGIYFQPLVGLQLKYEVTPAFKLSFGCATSKVFVHDNNERLSFINNQLQLGLHFPL